MDYRVLGPLEVRSGDSVVNLGGPKPRALVAILLAARGKAVSAPALAEELWSGKPPASAASTLQAYVSRLRPLLPDALRSEAGGYRLVPEQYELDADRFEAAVAAGRAARAVGDFPGAIEHLQLAEGLWRGPAIPELADAPAFRPEAARLDELRLTAIEERLELELETGRHSEAVPELEAATRVHPLRERLHGLLMLALYRSGRQTDALRAFQTARIHLAEDVGLDPGPELVRLEGAILAHDTSLDREPPSPTRRDLAPSPLRSALTSFVGRSSDLADLASFVEANRLVTLVGAGGAGKSRLALEVARGWGSEGDGWVAFVDLVLATEPDGVLQEFRGALGIAAAPDSETSGDDLAALIGTSRGLLVVDNAEHLLEAAAGLAERLLTTCPDLRILTTSRMPLGIAGEAIWRVAGLSAHDATELFRSRAGQAVLPGDDRVAAACARLDGLPLPIELAASRLRHMSFEALTTALDERLLDLDGAGPRDRVAHHRTVTALVEWSLDLLADDDRRLMHWLSVFEGGFEGDAVEHTAVATQVPHAEAGLALARLVDHSLVEMDATGRYRLLETVRAVCARCLELSREVPAAASSHLEWIAGLAASILDLSTDQASWVDRMRSEFPNVRAGLAWALGGGDDADAALRLATRAAGVWYMSGPMSEGRRWLEACLARATPDTFDYGRGLNYLAVLAWSQGDVPVAEPAARKSLEIFRQVGEAKWVAIGLNLLGDIARGTGQVEEALALNYEALALARLLDADTLGTALINLASIHLDVSDFALARPLVEEAAELLEQAGSDAKWAAALYNLAIIHKAEGDLPTAEDCLQRADEIFRRTGDDHGIAFVLQGRAEGALAESRFAEAAAFLDEGLALARERGDELFVADLLVTQARVEIASGLRREAEDSLNEVLAIERRCGSQLRTSEALQLLSRLSSERGSPFEARAFAKQALTVARDTGNQADIADASKLLASVA